LSILGKGDLHWNSRRIKYVSERPRLFGACRHVCASGQVGHDSERSTGREGTAERVPQGRVRQHSTVITTIPMRCNIFEYDTSPKGTGGTGKTCGTGEALRYRGKLFEGYLRYRGNLRFPLSSFISISSESRTQSESCSNSAIVSRLDSLFRKNGETQKHGIKMVRRSDLEIRYDND
jgi:hypothetical protein